jgi:hypothetical protein
MMHHLRWLTPAAALLVVNDPMAGLGQSRHFVQATSTSASPSIPDVFRRRSERSKWAISGSDHWSTMFDKP